MDYIRQLDICDPQRLSAMHVDLIGAGGIGSFTGLLLAKFGVQDLRIFDFDTVDDVNIASQMFRLADVGRPKAIASRDIWREFSDARIQAVPDRADEHDLRGIVIVAVDSMATRAALWERIEARPFVEWLIDGRMGAESGSILCLRPGVYAERRRYEASLYSDDEALELPCTGRAVIYNTAFVAGLVCRFVKRIVMDQPVESRIDFSLDDALTLIVEA